VRRNLLGATLVFDFRGRIGGPSFAVPNEVFEICFGKTVIFREEMGMDALSIRDLRS